eukprot:403359005
MRFGNMSQYQNGLAREDKQQIMREIVGRRRMRQLDEYSTDVLPILDNVAFTTKIAFGSEYQQMKLLVDTGSSWTWVGLTDCVDGLLVSQCDPGYYQYKKSTTFTETKDYKFIKYGSGSVGGLISYEQIFIGNSTKIGAQGVKFLAVSPKDVSSLSYLRTLQFYEKALDAKQRSDFYQFFLLTGIDVSFDGILGLSLIDESAGPLLVTYLWDQGIIDRFEFGILLSPDYKIISTMTIGGYDETAYDSSKNNMIGHGVSGSFHWQVHVVKIGAAGQFMFSTVPQALTDTGTTYTYLPQAEYDFIMSKIQKAMPSYMKLRMTRYGESVFTGCDDSSVFPSIQVQIDEYIYEIPSSSYMQNYQSACYPMLGVSKNDFWILGVGFLTNYYQVYDMKRNQIGLVVNKYKTDSLKVQDLGDKKTPILVITILGSMLIVGIQILNFKLLQRKADLQLNPINLYSEDDNQNLPKKQIFTNILQPGFERQELQVAQVQHDRNNSQRNLNAIDQERQVQLTDLLDNSQSKMQKDLM